MVANQRQIKFVPHSHKRRNFRIAGARRFGDETDGCNRMLRINAVDSLNGDCDVFAGTLGGLSMLVLKVNIQQSLSRLAWLRVRIRFSR